MYMYMWQVRGDAGECLLLVRRYFNRTPDDPTGLTFKYWQPEEKGEVLVINSSELRAVQGHQKNDFVLRPINPPVLRQKIGRSKKGSMSTAAPEIDYGPRQKWGLDPDIDKDTRKVCEAS